MLRWLGIMGVALTMSCSGSETGAPAEGGSSSDAKAEGRRDTLVIAYQSDIGNLIPMVNETSADSDILTNINFGMIDGDFDCTIKSKPALVKSWEWSEDGKVLKMELRDDITWEDGTKVTAKDVALTWELAGDPIVASPRISYVERMAEDKRPMVIDDTHIEWHFTETYNRDTMLSHASSIALAPAHKLADADRKTLRGNPLSKSPLASGPWRLAKHEPNQRIVLEPNSKFSGPDEYQPHLNRVIFRILPEYSTRLQELEAGNVDFMESINVPDADRLAKEHKEDIRLVKRGWRFMDYVAWNLSNPLFQDKNVRKALALGVDREGMITKLLTSESGERYGRVATSTITPELCGVHNDEIQPIPYDPEQAKKLFAEAGWTDSDGDGVLDKDGQKFSFTLTTNAGNKRRKDATILIQAQLKEIGVDVQLETLESNTFFENLRKREYESALAGWSAALFIDPTNIWHSDTPEKKYEFNFTGYSNPEVDALIDQGMQTADPAAAAPIWKDMQAKIHEDQPYLFLYWRNDIVGISSRFENTTIDILSPIRNLHEWEVPADKVKYKR